MKKLDDWQKVLGILIGVGTVLGGIAWAVTQYNTVKHDVSDLGNEVATLSTPQSARADMCKGFAAELQLAIRTDDSTAQDASERQLEKLKCYGLAADVQPEENMSAFSLNVSELNEAQ